MEDDIKSCENCKDADLDLDSEHCRDCTKYNKWSSGWTVENMNEDGEVCQASMDYKYEYDKVTRENIKLKQYEVMYKETIENLAMLLNSK